ncbi:MAG: hypothetical protein P8J24_00795, partial [Arenicellales bacterium]|nr:hypothetical protein [Arenicellales bacterium]
MMKWPARRRTSVPEDYKIAAKWYTLVAEQGNVYAQNNVGTMSYQGEGVPQDNWIGMVKNMRIFFISFWCIVFSAIAQVHASDNPPLTNWGGVFKVPVDKIDAVDQAVK